MVLWYWVSRLTDRDEGAGRVGNIFRVFGSNALFAYVLSTLIVKIVAQMRVWNGAHDALVSPYSRWWEMLAAATTPRIGSLLAALSLVALCWAVTWPLYKKRIFIKL